MENEARVATMVALVFFKTYSPGEIYTFVIFLATGSKALYVLE